MAEIINLRLNKKHRARQDREERAAQNRILSSIPGKIKKRDAEAEKRQRQLHELHRRQGEVASDLSSGKASIRNTKLGSPEADDLPDQ